MRRKKHSAKKRRLWEATQLRGSRHKPIAGGKMVKRMPSVKPVRPPWELPSGCKEATVSIGDGGDGPFDRVLGGYEKRELPDADPLIMSEKREKELKAMTQKARKGIKTMDAEMWVGRSMAAKGTDKRDVRHSRPPGRKDFKPAIFNVSMPDQPDVDDWKGQTDVSQLRAGELHPFGPIDIKQPSDAVKYGDGIDVETRSQMSGEFAERMGWNT